MRLTAVLASLLSLTSAMAAHASSVDWISFTFVGGFEEKQIAQSTTWINETCKPDELGSITGFSYKSSMDAKLGLTILCHQGSGKLGKVRIARTKFKNTYAFAQDQLRSATAVIIGFDFEKSDGGMEPIGEAVIVAKE